MKSKHSNIFVKKKKIMQVDKHIEKIIIPSFQTNYRAEAKVSALFSWMLEVAWIHADSLDWGYNDLQQNKMFWVLSRMRIEIDEMPYWRDEISIETWPSGNDRMFAYREYLIKNKAGKVLVRANSAWLILNEGNHKVVSFTENSENLPIHITELACSKPKRLRIKFNVEELKYSPVLYGDIDINNHFNSIRAFERVMNEYSIDIHKNSIPSSIEINYLKEGFGGDNLAIYRNGHNDIFQSAIIRELDGEILSLYEIEWTTRSK